MLGLRYNYALVHIPIHKETVLAGATSYMLPKYAWLRTEIVNLTYRLDLKFQLTLANFRYTYFLSKTGQKCCPKLNFGAILTTNRL